MAVPHPRSVQVPFGTPWVKKEIVADNDNERWPLSVRLIVIGGLTAGLWAAVFWAVHLFLS